MASTFLKILSNTKTRTLVLLTGGVLIVGILIAIASSNKSNEPLEKQASKTSSLPKGIESTPGAKTSEKYKALQEKANTIGAEKAEKKGGTFIPTIVSDNKPKNTEDLQSQFMKALEQADVTKNQKALVQDPRLNQLLAQQKQDDAATDALNKQRQAQAKAEQMVALNDQKLKAIETVAQAMEEQSKAALAAWNDVPLQAYNIGEWEANKKQRGLNSESDDSSGNGRTTDSKQVILKAGTILFASLETAINSDEPGPIMAKITQAPYKDAKLVGKIELPPNDGEKITLKFETLNIPNEPTSTKINAVAIDPDTARTALASKVDHHYLLRWGTLFSSAFLSGYSKAVAKSGTTVNASTVPGQSSVTTITSPLSGKQQFFEGLGEVGTKWSEQLGQNFSRKPTITIAPGTGIGVLVLSDVKLGVDPNSQKDQSPQTQTSGSNTNEQQKTNPNPSSASSADILNALVQNAAKINVANTQTPAQGQPAASKTNSSYNTSK